jgi:hypothetical protein
MNELKFPFFSRKNTKNEKENVNTNLYFQKSGGTKRAGCQGFWSEKIVKTTCKVEF